jgi:NAD+ kinase
MMLETAIIRGETRVETHQALNDVVIHKGTPARIVEVEARVDDQYVSTFRADGLIVSTPTGSTAYNMSAGGPIVHPALDAILLTPICSHTLTNRPIVLPAGVRIRVMLRSADEEGVFATLDGQVGISMEPGDILEAGISSRRVRLVAPVGKSYFDVLRGKLKWG